MNDIQYMAQTIINTVPCIEAAHAMGIRTDYKGRCPCFFHGGDHKNLKFYGENRGYYCFVCHAYGNVIDLVMAYQKISFIQAIQWLDDTFSLKLDFGGKAKCVTRSAMRNRIHKAEVYARKCQGDQKTGINV